MLIYSFSNIKKFTLLLIAFTTLSCQRSAVFDSFQSVRNEEWCRDEIIKFNTEIPTAGKYMIHLYLRHTTDYEMSNLWCFITMRDTEKEKRDTVNIKMAEPDGRWLGEGGNTLKTVEYILAPKVVNLPKGPISFQIEQGMRIECLKGMKDVGIKIQPVK